MSPEKPEQGVSDQKKQLRGLLETANAIIAGRDSELGVLTKKLEKPGLTVEERSALREQIDEIILEKARMVDERDNTRRAPEEK